jgi:DNA-binding MarR family transcriptional regulator
MVRTDPEGRAALQGRSLRELLVVSQLCSTRLNRGLRPLGVSLTQVSVMSHLARHPAGASVGDLARAMEINQPGVSKIVNALTERGWAETATGADDARIRVVRLTREGEDLLALAQERMHPEATLVFGDLDDARLAHLHDLLVTVRERLDADRGPAGDQVLTGSLRRGAVP